MKYKSAVEMTMKVGLTINMSLQPKGFASWPHIKSISSLKITLYQIDSPISIDFYGADVRRA